VGDVCGDTGASSDIVQGEVGDSGVELEKERKRLEWKR